MALGTRYPYGSVRQLVMLYSEATGQKMLLSATTPYAGSLVEQGGKLYQQASYQDGQAHVYASNLPTLGGIAAGTYLTPGNPNTAAGTGATYLSLNISGSDAANFMTGQFVTPQFVTDQAMAAQYSSYGRTQQSANMQLPGLRRWRDLNARHSRSERTQRRDAGLAVHRVHGVARINVQLQNQYHDGTIQRSQH
jgi:hypothetical protein